MSKPAILCVDDEVLVLESLGIQLQKAFADTYVYEFAESADEALEIIEEIQDNDIDIMVIVSDWLMPGIRGDEFLIQIHQKFPNIIKILLTGQADEAAIERATQEAQIHACLRKPWSSEELIETINSGIEQYE